MALSFELLGTYLAPAHLLMCSPLPLLSYHPLTSLMHLVLLTFPVLVFLMLFALLSFPSFTLLVLTTLLHLLLPLHPLIVFEHK